MKWDGCACVIIIGDNNSTVPQIVSTVKLSLSTLETKKRERAVKIELAKVNSFILLIVLVISIDRFDLEK